MLSEDEPRLTPITAADLAQIFCIRHDKKTLGWTPRLRKNFGYFIPDEYYEAIVDKLVVPAVRWLDVGCGRSIFPSNLKLAEQLASRCELLVGIDPDKAIEENKLLHQRFVGSVEEFKTDSTFDLVTLRMVAEHIADPERAVRSLSRLTRPGGKVVVYTVNRRSPVSIVSLYTPFSLHGPIKEFLWNTADEDTFPVYYRMNTRKELAHLFTALRFKERYFAYLDDCRSLSRFRSTMTLELCAWWLMRLLGLNYPENCLLAIYERL